MDVSRTIISKLILITGFFTAGVVNAQTTTTTLAVQGSPSGLSYYDPGTAATGTVQGTAPTIFGGNAGAVNGCATPVSTSTCDSCAGSGTLTSCNPTSVHQNLVLQVSLMSSTASLFQGYPRVLWKFSGETNARAIANTPTLAAGQTFTAEIRWGDLCSYGGGNGSCTADIITSKTLTIGIDNDNVDTTLEEKVDFTFAFRYVDGTTTSTLTAACPGVTPPAVSTEGVCDYTVARGDGKVYITDYAASSNDLTTSNGAVKYNRIAMFYLENVADASTVTTSAPKIILDLKNNSPSEPSISDQRVTGLTNDVPYCFALGNVDQAGNISYFPPAAVLGDANKVCATPSEVVGLLDDKSCFIATATFGSALAPEVQTFRQFRNQFLLNSSLGKAFVKAYYRLGPEAAEWVSHSEFLRTLSLSVLWPLLLFVKLSLALGLLPAFLIALASVLILKKSSSLLWQRRNVLKGDA